MSRFLVYVVLILVAAGSALAQSAVKGPEIRLSPGAAIAIDGKIEDAEWKGAVSFPTKNGGIVFFRYDGSYLFVGARGPAQGWSHLYINEGDDKAVSVYHASAALGSTIYRPDNSGKWQSSNPFSWELRDRAINPEVQKKMDDYIAKNFWVANNSNTGNKNEIEFKVKPRGAGAIRVAVIFAVGETGRYFFPETLSDDTINDNLVRGNTPPDLKFDPAQWATIVLPTQTVSKTSDDPAVIPDLLFAAMREKNAGKIADLFLLAGQLVAIDKPKDGKGISATRAFTADAFSKMIGGAQGREFIEKMPEKEVIVSGDLATVSGRYTFHVGDKFSHCGMNTFHLVRTDAGWKIANGASTLEFQCDADLKTVEIPVIAADPKDVSTIDGIIKAFYDTISGPKGQPRQWQRDRTLYVKDVRFIQINRSGVVVRPRIMKYMDYVNGSNDYLVNDGFTEREINRVTQRFGNIAQVASTYEWFTDEKKATGRGINIIQLFFDGTRWWISSATWEEESKDNPIPKEFMPVK